MGIFDAVRTWSSLDRRVTALEAGPKLVPGETCPKCGKRSLRVLKKATPTEVYDVWRCSESPCDHEEQRVADHWAHIRYRELVRSTPNYIVYISQRLIIGYDANPDLDRKVAAETKSSAIFSEGIPSNPARGRTWMRRRVHNCSF